MKVKSEILVDLKFRGELLTQRHPPKSSHVKMEKMCGQGQQVIAWDGMQGSPRSQTQGWEE